MTNKKWHTRFWLAPKWTTLDDLECLLRPTLTRKKHTKIFYHNFYNTWPILIDIDSNTLEYLDWQFYVKFCLRR